MGQEILRSFVVLEGLDGAGTTTQMRLLEQRLVRLGRRAFCTCEPTAGPIGQLIRRALRGDCRFEPRVMAWLFAADRWQHVNEADVGIRARVERGELVVSDRYLFSSLAYQGTEWDFEAVLELHREFPLPAVVIFIDTPVEICQKRLAGRREADIYDSLALQTRVASGYGRAFEAFAGSGVRFHRLDGRLQQEQLAEEVWKVVTSVPIMGT